MSSLSWSEPRPVFAATRATTSPPPPRVPWLLLLLLLAAISPCLLPFAGRDVEQIHGIPVTHMMVKVNNATLFANMPNGEACFPQRAHGPNLLDLRTNEVDNVHLPRSSGKNTRIMIYPNRLTGARHNSVGGPQSATEMQHFGLKSSSDLKMTLDPYSWI